MKDQTRTIEGHATLGINKIPITDIFRLKILSKPCLYEHVRNGSFSLYKLGGRSYVDIVEFNAAFKKVELKEKSK